MFLHQALAVMAGILLMITFGLTFREFKNQKHRFLPLFIGMALLILQGGAAALYRTKGEIEWITGLHYLVALAVLGLVLIHMTALFAGQKAATSSGRLQSFFDMIRLGGFPRLVTGNALAIFLLLLSGIIASLKDAGSVCFGWPICPELITPSNLPAWVNLFHRLMTLLSAVLIARMFIKSWREFRGDTAILVVATIVSVLFFSQVLMGMVESARGYPAYLIRLHSVTSVSVWAAIVILTTLLWLRAPIHLKTIAIGCDVERRNLKRLLLDYLMLTKPVVVLLLLVTTVAGMIVGAGEFPALPTMTWTLLAGFLAAGGSSAINQYIDRYDDQKMQRTKKRPLPAGRLTPAEGLAFGVASVLISFYVMVSLVNLVAALLTLAGAIYYVLIYSILLKKSTVQNIVIGGGAGAIPPLVGWAAATGGLNIPAMLLFAVVFFWTPPHFWALALVRRKDYARAGVPMLPVVRGEKETRWQIFLYTLQLVILTLLLPIFGLGGSLYFIGAVILGAYLLLFAWRVWKNTGNKVAWQMYRHSSMYLAFLFLVLMFDALI